MLAAVAAIYVIASLIAFVVFAVDKRAALRGDRRIPEATLHTIELLGGWPGALLAVYLLRHKSAKLRFRLIQWGIVALHLAVLTATFILRTR